MSLNVRDFVLQGRTFLNCSCSMTQRYLNRVLSRVCKLYQCKDCFQNVPSELWFELSGLARCLGSLAAMQEVLDTEN